MHSLRVLVEQMSEQLGQIALFGTQNTTDHINPNPKRHSYSVDSSAASIRTPHQRQPIHQSSAASIMTVRNSYGSTLAGSGETIRSMSSFNFESTLLNTRLYSRVLYKPWMNSAHAGNWSVLSGKSLAEVSNISVLELPLVAGALANPWWYDGSISEEEFLACLPVGILDGIIQSTGGGIMRAGEERRDSGESSRNVVTSWSAPPERLRSSRGRIYPPPQQEPVPSPPANRPQRPRQISSAPAVHYELDSISIERIRSQAPLKVNDFCYIAASAGESPFILAIIDGNVAAVKIYLENGADVLQLGRSGDTALNYAAKAGNLEVVTILVQCGADVNGWGTNGLAPLHWAASYGHDTVIEHLLAKEADVAQCCSPTRVVGTIGAGRYPSGSGQGIWHAARSRHTAAIFSFLSHGGPHLLDRCKHCNTTILNSCSIDPSPINLISEVLLAYGGPREVRVALLRNAIKLGDISQATRLAHNWTGPDLVDSAGRPLLYTAIELGNLDLLEALWYEGAAPAIIDGNLRSPLHLAASLGLDGVVRCLLRLGSNPNARDNDKLTPFQIAVRNKHDSTAVLLLDRNSTLYDADSDNYFNLHHAAAHGLLVLMHALLRFGIPVNRIDALGCTALHTAAACGHDNMVELLLNLGSDKDVKDNEGNTALVHAVREGKLQVAQRLCSETRPSVTPRVRYYPPLAPTLLIARRHRRHSVCREPAKKKCVNP